MSGEGLPTPSCIAGKTGDDALLRALIEELRPYAAGPLGSIRIDTDDIRKIVEWFDSLEAMARELAEARAENERLRKERDHWKFGHDASERQRDAAMEALRKIAFLRPVGPCRNKLATQMERIAIDALGGPGTAARTALAPREEDGK